MKPFPASRPVPDAPADTFASGHFWLIELVDGGHLRFTVEPSGLITFGDADRAYSSPSALPPTYRAAVSHVREYLDRDALRDAVDDVATVTFHGRATFRRAIAYDWDRIPPFLGYDVWTGERWLSPDAVERVYAALNLTPADVIERELRARDFTPPLDEFPSSAYYDGPVAGVVVRKKAGGRAVARNEEVLDREVSGDPPTDLDTFVAEVTAPDGSTGSGIEPATDPDEAVNRLLAELYRRFPDAFAGRTGFEERRVRTELAEQLASPGDAQEGPG